VEYERLADHIPPEPHSFVVIMSFGYRSDEAALRALLHLDFGYIGMMGSKAKVKAMFDQLLAEGIAPERLQRIFAPIGLDIKSETAEEIAVSVAAQLIAAKNRPVFRDS
ncbi:MAG TPA: XdhC family protein, partial [Saprospiraceae bacterium]|nr:XdhC family protein [Saprospiraceae bacterium]